MNLIHGLRQVRFGRERLEPGYDPPRHRHLDAYALIVVAGEFEQASYAGRVRVGAGDMLVQPTLDCHANRMVSRGLEVLRLPWPGEAGVGGVYALEDLDGIVRLAATDGLAAVCAARQSARQAFKPRRYRDWPDLLAADLLAGTATSIAAWAEAKGLARETVARGFARAYGVSPARFRGELRARRAWLRLATSTQSFARIAAEMGYADQPHMTRDLVAFTGLPPSAWRSSLPAITPTA